MADFTSMYDIGDKVKVRDDGFVFDQPDNYLEQKFIYATIVKVSFYDGRCTYDLLFPGGAMYNVAEEHVIPWKGRHVEA